MKRASAARICYAAAAFAAMALGYASRALASGLPDFVPEQCGDALWAAMIYFGVRCLRVRKSPLAAFAASLAFCYAIEFSQLYRSDWIDGIRSTVPGSLVLGQGFLAADLLRYGAGIAAAWLADTAAARLRKPQEAKERSGAERI